MKDPLGQLRLRYAGLRLVQERRYGRVYAGKDFSGNDVTLVVLGEEAAADPARRRAFAETLDQHRSAAAAGEPAVHAADARANPPWAAVRASASSQVLAARVLAALVGERPATGGEPSPVLEPPSLVDALAPTEPPPLVRPDPTFATPLPPSTPAPAFQSPTAEALQPPPGQRAPSRQPAPARRQPPVRQRPSGQPRPGQPPPPVYSPAGSPAVPRPAPVAKQSGRPAARIVAGVVIAALLLAVCCVGVVSSV